MHGERGTGLKGGKSVKGGENPLDSETSNSEAGSANIGVLKECIR